MASIPPDRRRPGRRWRPGLAAAGDRRAGPHADWPDPGQARDSRLGRMLAAMLRAPVSGRTWRELAYCIASVPLGLGGFVLVVVLIGAGAGLTVTLVGAVPGLALLVLGLRLARALGDAQRWLAERLLCVRMTVPPPRPRAPSVAARLESALRDGRSWRSAAYVVLRVPLTYPGYYAVLVCWLYGLFFLTYPIWWSIAPGALSPLPAGGLHISTLGGAFLIAVFAIPLLLVAPWLTRGLTRADGWLLTRLLAPAGLAARVAELERTRALAVDDAAARLRKVERDLHDGAQARLAALALTLGMAREKLDEGGDAADADRARALVETAHASAKQALVELRDLARGIHPPVLDNGLPEALESLVAQSVIPIRLGTDIAKRPTPAIETIAYFCAAELVANVVKHSGATTGRVEVARQGGVLVVRVADNGRGGAHPAPGGGLAGLAERVQTVDGAIGIDSPAGGPTVVTVELPMHA